jgi:hypothetical protein
MTRFSVYLFASGLFLSNVALAQSYTPPPVQNAAAFDGGQSKNLNFYKSRVKYPGVSKAMEGKKRKFNVMLLDDSVVNVRSDIFSDSIHFHFLQVVHKGDTFRILPADTKRITTFDPEIKQTLYGYPADTCWLFKSSVGQRVNFYRNVPEFGKYDIKAIQQQPNGPIVALTRANVEAIIGKTRNKAIIEYLRLNLLVEALDEFNK